MQNPLGQSVSDAQARHDQLQDLRQARTGSDRVQESRYFWERNYGSKSFRVLLSRLPGLVEVKKDRSSSDMRVTLLAARPARKS